MTISMLRKVSLSLKLHDIVVITEVHESKAQNVVQKSNSNR